MYILAVGNNNLDIFSAVSIVLSSISHKTLTFYMLPIEDTKEVTVPWRCH